MPYPIFWFDRSARAAMQLYEAAFPGAEITLDNGFLFELKLNGSVIGAMNGGPMYRPNKTLSVFVELPSPAAVDAAYQVLGSERSQVYLELNTYDWSQRYVWLVDEWGVNWQLVCKAGSEAKFSPALLFTGQQAGMGEEAIKLYSSCFPEAKVLLKQTTATSSAIESGGIVQAQLELGDDTLMLSDSTAADQATFTEGGSLMVLCQSQAEIDHYWQRLIAGGGSAGRCGWLKDRFGVSWQIVPRELSAWMSNPARAPRVGQALQQMTKLNIAELQQA